MDLVAELPLADGESSAENDSKAIEKFSLMFYRRYLSPGPALFMGSLEQALNSSVFNRDDPRPLVVCIHHERSIATNIFCETVLCSQAIIDYLAEQFLVWAWDRTNDNNLHRLRAMLHEQMGDEISASVTSAPVDTHPLLVCLSFEQGQIGISIIIQGSMTKDETLERLQEARRVFDRRIELPDTADSEFLVISDQNSSSTDNLLISVDENSDTFRKVVNDLAIDTERIVSIHQIENSMWLPEYLDRKEIIEKILGHNQTDRLLFHECSRAAAEKIVQQKFDQHLIGTHGTQYGRGFYFSSSPLCSQFINVSNGSNDQRSILMCRVIIGRSCLGTSDMKSCPNGYNSTTDGSNIYVVYSNQQILPEFLVTYT